MNEDINCYIKELNFVGLENYLFENIKDINKICSCICSHNVTVIIKILEICGKKIKNENVLDQLHNEITSEEHFDIISLHIRNYVHLLYKIIYHFDKIENIENNKKLCEHFVTFSIYLIIYFEQNEFIEQLVLRLIHKFEEKRKNGYNKYIIFQLEKNFYDLYCFIHLPHFIFINSFLLCSFASISHNTNHITNNDFDDIITNLKKLNFIFQKIQTNVYNENTKIHLNDHVNILSQKINKENNNYHLKYLNKTKIICDTISNDNIKIIYNHKDIFSLSYKYINLCFDTNIYSLDEKDYEQNYNVNNINVNNFLLLLKILSPSFFIWTAIHTKFICDEKNNYNKNDMINQISNKTQMIKQNYTYKHMYIINNRDNINYLKDTSDCFFFFFWYLLSLNQTSIKLNDSINTLMVNIINNFFHFFIQRSHHLVHSQKDTQNLLYYPFINKNFETYLCKENQKETINNLQNKEKQNFIDTSTYYNTFCELTSELLFRNKNKILLNLKNLIIWAYISPDDTEEMNFFNMANIFVFNNNTCDILKRHENVYRYIHQYIHQYIYQYTHKFLSNHKDIFLFYNYTLFKKTYECKTLSFKYMDNFSNYISSFILNIIFNLTKYYLSSSFFCGQLNINNSNLKKKNSEQAIILAKKNKNQEIQEQKMKQNKIYSNNDINHNNTIDNNLLPNGEYKNIEKNHLSNLLQKESTLNELSNNILNSYFHFKNYTYDERIEYLFNELLFISFKFINYPLKHVQHCCIDTIMEIITKMNIYNHIQYINKKSDTFITFLYDESFNKNHIIKCYMHIKCKLTNHININLLKSIEHLIQICNLKLSNKTLCSIISKHILISFNYHPSLLPIILYKYIKIIIYLMETNNINIILDSLKCLHILYIINPQEIKIFNHDIIYRLHLLFNIFNQNDKNVENHISFNSIKQFEYSKDNNCVSSNNITSYLKKFYFNNIQIEKRREEMLLHIKLILYSIYLITPPDEYLSSLKIFEYYPKEYEIYSKNFEIFSRF
ncbi:hypothetical protein PGSY75_1310100 [Plasmodium gaboni]|uniref:Uncharacterized protein n=1 Tax=Plasmodium gaboni TaxID=647221 RepID=A0A151LD67_9APIC|nr:hypothetical protein PGSY75_1310100 [Plasmodium gaboni]KYN96902.1 hypothetical protein PGSY75_1310100 [Plasmodium gaboni]